MHSFSTVAALAAVAALPAVSAHGYVSGIVADGVYHEGTSPSWIYGTKPSTPGWYAKNQDNGFVDGTSYTSGDIICHKEATPGATSVPVTAGSKVDLQWSTWPDSHKGPVIDYLARCPGDCTAVDKESLIWFKVDGKGLNAGGETWASDDLIANNNTWTVTIPANIAPGHFVLRHEIIALHGAGSTNGAQNYPQCINIEVKGSGATYPCREGAECPKGTALYKTDAPGILLNIYTTLTSYTVPGPAVWTGLKTNAKRIAQAFTA